MIQALHSLCTLFQLLLYQLHFRSSGTRIWRPGTPGVDAVCVGGRTRYPKEAVISSQFDTNQSSWPP